MNIYIYSENKLTTVKTLGLLFNSLLIMAITSAEGNPV